MHYQYCWDITVIVYRSFDLISLSHLIRVEQKDKNQTFRPYKLLKRQEKKNKKIIIIIKKSDTVRCICLPSPVSLAEAMVSQLQRNLSVFSIAKAKKKKKK